MSAMITALESVQIIDARSVPRAEEDFTNLQKLASSELE